MIIAISNAIKISNYLGGLSDVGRLYSMKHSLINGGKLVYSNQC